MTPILPFPEEMNRTLVGTSPGRPSKEKIFITGNTVIDAMKTTVQPDFVFADDTLNRLDFPGKQVITLTCHRRENYGAPMEAILTAVRTIVEQNSNVEVVYPRPPEPRGPGLRPPPPGDHPGST